jgi:hypothetical protein
MNIFVDEIEINEDQNGDFKTGCFKLIDLMGIVKNAQKMKRGKKGREIILGDVASQIVLIIDIYFPNERLEKYTKDYLDLKETEISELDGAEKTEVMATLRDEFKPIESNDSDLQQIDLYVKDSEKESGF